tara:strand:+ start:1280 stop:2581 length:1302 start_codon:yes stop_codon:yes gene_type:complete
VAKFNPITDLMPLDSSMESTDQSAEQIEVIRTQLIETRNGVSNVLNVIKAKNTLLDRDLKKIKSLNQRLKTTIPRIPILPGIAGVEFGEIAKARRKRGGGFSLPRLPFLLPSISKTKTKTKYKNQKLNQNLKKLSNIKDKVLLGSILLDPKRVIKKKYGPGSSGKFKFPSLQKIFERVFGKKNKTKVFPEVSRVGKIKRKGSEVLSQIRAENLIDDVQSSGKVILPRKVIKKKLVKEPVINFEKQRTLFPTVPEGNLAGGNALINQLRSGNLAKSKLYKTLGLDDKFTRNNFANYLEPANPKFQAKILKELGLLRGTSMKTPVSKDTFRFIMNAFKPSDFMLNQIKSGKMPTAIDPRINIFNKLKDSGYNIRLQDIVPKKDFPLLKKGLRLEDMPFKKDVEQLQLNAPRDLSSLNIDTGITNTVIILTDPPVA